MSERQIDYVDDSGNVITTLTFAEGTTNEEINEYVSTYADEIETAAGVREPGFGPLTMGLVPESFERGLYRFRQFAGAAAADAGLIEPETAQEDFDKMNRYLQYSTLNLDPEEQEDLNTIQTAFSDAKESPDTLGSVVDFFKPFAENPDAMFFMLGEVFGTSVPALGAAAAGAVVGGTPGLVIGSFLGSAATEYGAAFVDAFQEAGVDADDNQAVLNVFSDPEKLAEVRKNAQIRGVTVGTFDALTLGFAGKLSGAITKGVAKPKIIGKGGAGAGAELGLQAAGGAGGEALSQYLTDRYDPGEVIVEALAEGVTTPVDVVLARKTRGDNKVLDILEQANLTPTAITEFDKRPTQERLKILEDIQEGNVENIQRDLGMTDQEIIASNAYTDPAAPEPEFIEETIIEEDPEFNVADIEALDLSAEASTELNQDNSVTTTDTGVDVDVDVDVGVQPTAETPVDVEIETKPEAPKASITVKEIDNKVIETQIDSQGRKRVIEKIKKPAPVVEKSAAGKILDELNAAENNAPSETLETTTVKGVTVDKQSDQKVIDEVTTTVKRPKSKVSPEVRRLVNAHKRLNAARNTGAERGFEKSNRQVVLQKELNDAAKAVYSSPDITLEEVAEIESSLAEGRDLPVLEPEKPKNSPEKLASVAEGETKQEHNTRLGTNSSRDAEVATIETAVQNQSEDPSAMQGPSEQPANEIAPNTAAAITDGNIKRAESIPGDTLKNANKSLEYEADIFKVTADDKDMNIWDSFIKFPDVNAEKYPSFAPLFNAIKLRDGLRNQGMADILQPFEVLKDFKRGELHSTLKAVVLLDQIGSIRVDENGNKTSIPYAKDGFIDDQQLETNADGKFVIKAPSKEVIKQNNLDMTILEDPTTGSGLLEVVKDANNRDVPGVELTQKELEGVKSIFLGMKTALELVLNSTMPQFNFQSGTTVGKLRTLIRDLNTVKNNPDAFNEAAATQADAARQIIEDSGLVIDINDPESGFKAGKSIDEMIEALSTFNDMISPLQSNPFYIPHKRPGRIGVRVKKDGKTVWMQSVDLKELRERQFEIRLPTDQGVPTRIPLSRAPSNVRKALQSKGIQDLKSQLNAKVNAGVFGSPDEAAIEVEAFDIYENSFKDAMTLTDLNAAETVFEHVFDSLMVNPQDGVTGNRILPITEGSPAARANKEFVEQFRSLLKQGKAQILARRDPTMPLTRKNIPGWITQENLVDNLLQSLTVYGARAAGFSATQKTASLTQKGVDNTASLPELHKYALRYQNEVESGSSDYGHMKRIAFHYFLGFNVSSALVNFTQIPMSALPYIARFSSGGSASREILTAFKDAGKIAGLVKGLKRTGGGRVSELIKLPFEQTGLANTTRNRLMWSHMQRDLANGRLMSQVTAEQLGLANYGNDQVFRSTLGRAENISSAIFTYAELVNRLTTYIAAHRTYTKSPKFQNKINKALRENYDYQSFGRLNQETGQVTDPARLFAAFTVDKTQYYMGVENRPTFMRGPVLGVVTQFMQFPARYLQMITRLAFDATAREGNIGGFRGQGLKERAGALSAMAGFMIFTGGFWSLPLAQQAGDLYDLIYKGLYNVDPVVAVELHRALMDAGIEYPEYFTRGVLPQLANIALVNRTGAGVVLQPEMFSGDPTKAFGPAGSMLLGSASSALTNLHRGDYMKAFANLLPTAGYNLIKSSQLLHDGYATTNRGIMKGAELNVGLGEAVVQAIGFQPESLGKKFESDFLVDRAIKRTGEKEQAYRDMLRGYISKYLFNQRIAESGAPNIGQKEKLEARKKMNHYAEKYKQVIEDIKQINQDTLGEINRGEKDTTYLFNITPRSIKAITKNAYVDTGLLYKPGPKKTRRDELQYKYDMGSREVREKLIKRFGSERFE